MTKDILDYKPEPAKRLAISSYELAELAGKAEIDVVRDVLTTFSGVYSTHFFNFIGTDASVGIRGEFGYGGLQRVSLHKQYAMTLATVYGNVGVYETLDESLAFTEEDEAYMREWGLDVGDFCTLKHCKAKKRRRKKKKPAAPETVVITKRVVVFVDHNDPVGIADAVMSEVLEEVDFSKPKPGSIYLIEHPDTGAVKIGSSNKPVGATWKEGSILKASRIFIGDPVFQHDIVCQMLHRVFASKRAAGWYNISIEQAAEVVTLVAEQFRAAIDDIPENQWQEEHMTWDEDDPRFFAYDDRAVG